MISEDTVLILGAGASVDYGYPLGRNLMLNICNDLHHHSTHLFQLLHNCDNRVNDIQQFCDDLRACNLPSIDAFLEKRPEFEKIGKIAIAASLIPHEDPRALSRTGWYEYLHGLMIGRKEEFEHNKLSVVTFNYDRSFEASLFISIQRAYNLSDAEAASLLKKIPIIHVYGQLGELPHLSESPFSRPYDSKVHAGIASAAASGIKIIHEGKDNTTEFQQAREKLSKAKIICCLGFGYHRDNVTRLDLPQVLKGKGKQIYLSTHGLTQSQSDKLKKRLFPNGHHSSVQMHAAEDKGVRHFLTVTAALE